MAKRPQATLIREKNDVAVGATEHAARIAAAGARIGATDKKNEDPTPRIARDLRHPAGLG